MEPAKVAAAWRQIAAQAAHFIKDARIDVSGFTQRAAITRADALIRRLAGSDPQVENGGWCHYCGAEIWLENVPHAPGCLWQDVNDFTSQEAGTK